MFISSPFQDGPPMALNGCASAHRDPMWHCPPGAVACHAGTFAEEPDVYQNPNRVLAFIPYLRWTQLLRRVDLADIDDVYGPGERIVTLHKNDGLFQDAQGLGTVAYLVTQRHGDDVTCYVSAFTDEESARQHFAAAIEP